MSNKQIVSLYFWENNKKVREWYDVEHVPCVGDWVYTNCKDDETQQIMRVVWQPFDFVGTQRKQIVNIVLKQRKHKELAS